MKVNEPGSDKNKVLNVSRKELKYLINFTDYSYLSTALRGALDSDKHNGAFGYSIRSLYFDTPSNTDFHEKMDGLEKRKKIRLRCYSHEDTVVKLEIKRKIGDNQRKLSVMISREDAKELIKCNYDVLLKYSGQAVETIYNLMKFEHYVPVVLIEYRRKAFIHPTNNIRITLDSDIRSSETCFGLFDKHPMLYPTMEENNYILEVKYDGFLYKWIGEILWRCDTSRLAISKYSTSRWLYDCYMA